MSFLADPPLLVACGAAANLLPRERDRRLARRATLAAFLGTSVSLYLEAPWTRPMWRALRAPSGRDWMVNSGVTHFSHDGRRPGLHAAAVGLFALYPLWYRLGEGLGRRAGIVPLRRLLD